jgi:hypothetical protein
MKRAFLLIFALLLMIDLAEDGCLGKASFIPPHSSAKASVTSPYPHGSGNPDSPHVLALPDLQGPCSPGRSRLVTYRIRQTFKISEYCFTGSSGGIPL